MTLRWPNLSLWMSLALAAGLFTSGYLSGAHARGHEEAQTPTAPPTVAPLTEWREPGKLTQPLLECDTAPNTATLPTGLQNAIVAAVDAEEHAPGVAQVSVYFRALAGGQWLGVHDQAEFTPASLMKVPILMAWMRLADEHPEALDRPLPVVSVQSDAMQTIRAGDPLVAGQSYPASVLLDHLIGRSSNAAADALIAGLPPYVLDRTFLDLGLTAPAQRRLDDSMSVREYASFFRVLYNATYLSHAGSERALQYLTRSMFHNGLVAGLPQGTTVAHKFGEREVDGGLRQLHDCGVVYAPKRPYVLCVMTRGTQMDALKVAIQRVSAATYAAVMQHL